MGCLVLSTHPQKHWRPSNGWTRCRGTLAGLGTHGQPRYSQEKGGHTLGVQRRRILRDGVRLYLVCARRRNTFRQLNARHRTLLWFYNIAQRGPCMCSHSSPVPLSVSARYTGVFLSLRFLATLWSSDPSSFMTVPWQAIQQPPNFTIEEQQRF